MTTRVHGRTIAPGSVSDENLGPASVTLDQLEAGVIPVGTVWLTARPTVPTGWLPCDGAAVGRTVFPALFQTIGLVFGEGNGTTTFNVPDLTGPDPDVVYIIKT